MLSLAAMVQWKISNNPVSYEEALSEMNARVSDIHEGKKEELIWLLEHPPLYTAGTSAKEEDLRNPEFPVYETGRGGEYTYHGPGQRIAYAMLDLKQRYAKPDIKHYIWSLEEWIIKILAQFDIKGERRAGRVGIWVETEKGEKKIAAIGVRVRHWITLHGFSLNIDPDLSHFDGIVPCGISEYGVTSMKEPLKTPPDLDSVDKAIRNTFEDVF